MVVLYVLFVSLAGLILLSVGSVFLAYTLYVHYVHVKYSHIPGPKRTSFYLGNLPELRRAVADKRIIDDVFLEWSNKHGRIYVFYVLHHVNVNAYIPEVIRDILVTDNYSKPPEAYRILEQQFGQRMMGKSLVTEVNHESWQRMNALFSPAFHRNFLKTCIVQFNASCDLLLEELSKKADGKTEVKMLEMFNKVSLDGISKVAFGMSLSIFEEETPQILTDIKMLTEASLASYLNPLLWCSPFKAAVDFRSASKKAIRNVRKTARDCILDHMEALKRGEEVDNILSHILQMSTNTSTSIRGEDLEKMVDQFVTFFAAGQETTACLLASTLLELARHPEVAYKMKTEANAVIGENGYVSFEDLSKLKYTTAVLKESLRYHPPIPDIMRKVPHDVTWNNIKIPAGTNVSVGIMNLGMLEEHFESPDEFMPSRFLGEDSYKYVHIPFSLGPRKCIGQQFAMIEARVVMAKLLKYFNFDLVPGQSFHYIKSITCKPKDGCLVYIKPAAKLGDFTNTD